MIRIQKINKRDMFSAKLTSLSFPTSKPEWISEFAYQAEEESTFGIPAVFLIRGALFVLVHAEGTDDHLVHISDNEQGGHRREDYVLMLSLNLMLRTTSIRNSGHEQWWHTQLAAPCKIVTT
jgi:hypothetical protein